MALPKLLQKLFANGGVGPLLRSDIMPDGVAYIGVANNAGAHNSIYRGADITSRHANGSLSTQVQAGDFTDIFIGDYITATTTANGSTVTTKWRVADIDYYMKTGDNTDNDGKHHLVLVPDACMFHACMNSTNTTEGGYLGSAMWTTYIPMCVTAIRSAFGSSHVLSWRALLANSISTSIASMAGCGWMGAANAWLWVDVSADIMSEPQLYGTTILSSSFRDGAFKKRQFSLFGHDPALMNIRDSVWLSDVSSGTRFANIGHDGNASASDASFVAGVRPHFLYH